MTTIQDIDRQIQKDVDNFNNSIFDGNLPSEVFDAYSKAVSKLSSRQFCKDYKIVKSILSKRIDELTIIEVGFLMNTIGDRPIEEFGLTLHASFELAEKINNLTASYNKITAEFEKKIIKKRSKLLELSGVNNSVKL